MNPPARGPFAFGHLFQVFEPSFACIRGCLFHIPANVRRVSAGPPQLTHAVRWPASARARRMLGIVAGSLLYGCSTTHAPPLAAKPVTAAPARAPAPAPEVDGDRRLSRSVEPLHYWLEFTIDPNRDEFTGQTRISVKAHQPTRWIYLHAQGLRFTDIHAELGTTRVKPEVVSGRNSGLALGFPQAVRGELVLSFTYSAELDEIPTSLYRAKDGGSWYAFTQFEPLSAREAFPCFDEPQFKTPYTTSIITPTSLIAASNSPLKTRSSVDGMTRHEFITTEPLPSYLVALAVGDFDIATAPATLMEKPPLRILTTQGKGTHTGYALNQTPRILRELTAYFGSPYPYRKLDKVAVPSFRAGAMENAGLVTYREQFLISDEASMSAPDKLRAQSIIAHELAHMWFGNLVTMQWWDDLWLNEAFATWMSNRVLKAIAPETEPELQAVNAMLEVMETDALVSATPIRKQIENSGDIHNAFDRITYVKGLSVLRMLENWVGPNEFRDGIRTYLTKHAWGSATMFDLLSAIDQAAQKPVSPIAKGFVEQPGVPLVNLEWSCEGDGVKVSLDQTRYSLAKVDRSSDPVWTIPVCLIGGKGQREARECFLFDTRTAERTLGFGFCPSYLHPNAGEYGYYRWKLEPTRLADLFGEHRSKLSLAERIALPLHAFALLEVGAIDGAAYVQALQEVGAEQHWLALKGLLQGISQLVPLTISQQADRHLAVWTRGMLSAHARRIRFIPRPKEPVASSLAREALFYTLASIGWDGETLKQAGVQAQAFLEDPDNVPTEVADLSLSIAALQGDRKLHDGLVSVLRATRSPTTRQSVVKALGRFRNPALLARSFDLLLEGDLRAQDYRTLVYPTLRDQELHAGFWAWYTRHESELRRVLGDRLSETLPWAAAGFCSEKGIELARQHFANPAGLGPGAAHNLNQALETARRCAARRQAHGAAISAQLAQQ